MFVALLCLHPYNREAHLSSVLSLAEVTLMVSLLCHLTVVTLQGPREMLISEGERGEEAAPAQEFPSLARELNRYLQSS